MIIDIVRWLQGAISRVSNRPILSGIRVDKNNLAMSNGYALPAVSSSAVPSLLELGGQLVKFPILWAGENLVDAAAIDGNGNFPNYADAIQKASLY